MKDIRKALETVALHNLKGAVPDDLLIKACEAYKIQSEEFDDSYEYHVCVAKSLYDHLNGVEPDSEICKAILPGQTKVVDGVVYIYTSTPNAKTKYDWRVLQTTKHSAKVGRQVADDKIKNKQDHVNDLFPSDLSTLKAIKKLGGSTGAELVEDSRGNQYVMKKGKNTSNEHVKSEYMTNQLYDLLGLKVPDFELYDEGGEAVMLSKYIPITTVPTAKDYDAMAKGFAVDALLANWDVYQNDNCLVDSAGRIIRVDNGGALAYRAQGAAKPFGTKVTDFDSMLKYNPAVLGNLSTQDLIDQIDDLLKKGDDVLEFLIASNEGELLKTFIGRFKDLEVIKNNLQTKLNAKNRKVLPRNLKDDAEMYRDLEEDELDAIWKNQGGSDYYSKLFRTDYTVGWQLLSSICQERGFTARPEVVDDQEYWNRAKGAKYQIFRGLSSGGGKGADYYADDFRYNDNCFYGTIGIHGSGLYFHVNDGINDKSDTKTTYKSSDAYKAARGYAGSSGEILDCFLDPSAKVALVEDVKKEILSSVTFDKKAVKAKEDEIEATEKELKTLTHDLDNITIKTENDVKTKMHWDNKSLVEHQLEIDNTDWGATDDQGNPEYPSFENFVEDKMFKWVKSNGGTVTEKGKDSGVFVFKLPNSKESFMLSRYQYENNAIKRKNAFSKAYNYPVKRFADWLMKEHYNVINKQVERAIENIGSKVQELQGDIKVVKGELNKKISELGDLKKTKDPNGDIISGIYESVRGGSKEAIGTYAALKGIDAIIEPRGNGGPNSFMIVLNRSKVVVRK